MSKRIQGITIELDGETKGLDKALKDVNKRSRDVTTELKDIERLLKFNPGNVELLEQRQKLLGDQVENTTEKLRTLRDAEKDVQKQFEKGEIKEKQYRDFQKEIIETESKLKSFEGKLSNAQREVKDFGEKMEDAGKKMKGIGDGMKDVGGSMSARFTAPILGGLALVTKGTEEYRQDLARLETNAELAGISSDKLSEAMLRLSGVSEETDSNVEALSNLMAAGLDEQGMLEALDALSGAMIKFPDTLKIEGLADGLQETLATGEAIGPFAELLERLGVPLETFNEGLAKATESGKEQQYVLDVLAKTGLADVNEAYRKNNEELVKSREEQQKFRDEVAELGETLTPIITTVTEKVRELVDWFNQLDEDGQKMVITIAGIVAAIGPLLMVLGTIISLMGSLAIAAGALGIGMLPLLAIIALVVAAIVGLIAIGVLLYKNWDKVKAVTMAVWSAIKDWLVRTISTIVGGIAKGITDMRTAVAERMAKVQTAITDIWGKITGFFDGIDLYESGKAIIQGAIDGILSMANPITNAVENIVGLVRDYWPFSPAKRGPLSDIHKMDFAGPIGDSIKKAENPLLRNMESLAGTVAGVMPQMSAPSSAGTGTSTVNLADMLRGANIHIRKDSDIEDLARQLARHIKNSPGVAL